MLMAWQHLGNILGNHQPRSAMMRSVLAAQIVAAANAALVGEFGPGIEQSAQAAYFKNGLVTIACLNSVTAQEIKLREQKILETIQNEIKTGEVKGIRFSL